MENTKFKKAGLDCFIKIYLNEDGSENSRTGSFSSNSKPKTSGYGMNKEMIAWKAAGNTIEDQYTPEELAQKESDDLALAEKQIIDDAKTWLNDNDWKYNQYQRRVARETITPEQETEFKTFLDYADEKAQLIN